MPKESVYVRTEWYTRINIKSTLTKASPLHCTTAWLGEPPRKMAWHELWSGYGSMPSRTPIHHTPSCYSEEYG